LPSLLAAKVFFADPSSDVRQRRETSKLFGVGFEGLGALSLFFYEAITFHAGCRLWVRAGVQFAKY
jgi:hypothetical protein